MYANPQLNPTTISLRPLHPAQLRIRAEARRFNVVSCGRRFGKTDFGLDEAIAGAKGLLDAYPVGWFAPNARYFEEVWLEAQRILAPIRARSQEQKKRITLVNGGVLEFWDLEDPDAGRSRKYGKVIIDEAAKVTKLEQAWEQAIAPTLIDYAGDAYFLSSPKGFNFFKQLHDRGNSASPSYRDRWMSWTFASSDNPHVSADEIARISAELPELARRQEIEGAFVDIGGASVQRAWVRYGGFNAHELEYSVAIGVDLAISTKDSADWTAIVTIARTAKGETYILEVKRFRKPFHAILREIEAAAARAAEKWKPVAIIGIEQNQYQAAVVQELLRTTNLPVRGVTAHQDKLTRFQPVLARYEQGLMLHGPGLPAEFEEELFAFPLGDHKDMVDALAHAYAVCPKPDAGSNMASAGNLVDFRFGDEIDESEFEGNGLVFPE